MRRGLLNCGEPFVWPRRKGATGGADVARVTVLFYRAENMADRCRGDEARAGSEGSFKTIRRKGEEVVINTYTPGRR